MQQLSAAYQVYSAAIGFITAEGGGPDITYPPLKEMDSVCLCGERNMDRRNIFGVSATIVLGLALLGVDAGATARGAEIKLLCAVALQPGMVALIPDFEKS